MIIYCLVCNNEFEADVATRCPHCGAVGDDLEPCDEESTDEDLEAMFADYNERHGISRPLALMGAI